MLSQQSICRGRLLGLSIISCTLAASLCGQTADKDPNPNAVAILRWYPANLAATFPVGRAPAASSSMGPISGCRTSMAIA